MKAVIIEIDSVLNEGAHQQATQDIGARKALNAQGIHVTLEQFNEMRQAMREARADDVFLATLWQLYKPFAINKGWDKAMRAKEWLRLIDAYRGYAGYEFHLRAGARELIEELKFNAVDSWGNSPAIIAVNAWALGVEAAFEWHKLTELFDEVVLPDRKGPRYSDTRFLQGIAEEFGRDRGNCMAIGGTIENTIRPARALGMRCIWFTAAGDAGMPPRGPWEEPEWQAQSISELGNIVLDWLNAPAGDGEEK